MRPSFARRTEGVMQSYIMSLIEVARRPGMISFATGLPDRRLFDPKGLEAAAERVLESGEAADALQYGATAGFMPLREKIADRCNRELGMHVCAEDVFITNGSQECFDHLGKLFLDPGDGIAVENPGYLGALQSFSVYGPEFIPVDMRDGGPDMSQLTDAFARKPKLYYCVPNHQNPSGTSYSADARKQVAEAADAGSTLVLEDDAYGELGYHGRAGKAIASMTQNAVLTGSISKIISPGMRVGWMVVPEWMRESVSTSLEAACLHAGSFSQRVLDAFLEMHDLDAYLKPIRAEYARKCKLFTDLMADGMPDSMSWTVPDGGMFVLLSSPKGTDAEPIFKTSMERGLVVMPGKPFHIRGGANTIRLNFATAGDEEIKKGMDTLCGVCRELF